MRFSPGDTFDRYVIESLVGEGGMGEVYRAEDTRLRRKVALKVLRAGDAGDGETWSRAVARMQREAHAVAALSHPGIVGIYDVGEHDGTPFIAMEFVEGKSLRVFVGQNQPIGVVLRVLLDMAKALSAAHQAGIIHRDVKPENVIVRDDGVVKVLDFGIARREAQRADPTAPTVDGALLTRTAEGVIVGTPAYMAPEQLRGEDIDARADQFAFGVVAYELIAGKLPFRADKGAVSLIASILGDEPEPLVGVPEALGALIERALAKWPEERFGSMDEVATELRALVTLEETKMTDPNRAATALTKSGERSAARRADIKSLSSKRHWALPVAAVSALAVFAVLFAYLKRPGSALPTQGLPSASARASTGPVALTDLPIPASESAAAKLAFREGLQATRDAMWETAAASFDRARKADPGMAAAHLRYSMVGLTYDKVAAREAYRKAVLLRADLSERDAAVLDALEPVIQSDPIDNVTAARKFEAVSARYPQDAELVFWHARTTLHAKANKSGIESALALAERCVELDPRYADCWQTKEWALLDLHREDDALAALDKCAEVSPNAVDCLNDKIKINTTRGHCPAVIETARRWMAKEPSAPAPYRTLSIALFAAGEPQAAVRASLDQAEKRFSAKGSASQAYEVQVFRAIMLGDFAEATRLFEDPANTYEIDTPGRLNGYFIHRAELSVELGKPEEAAKLADEFFEKKGAISTGDREPTQDPTVLFHALRLRAGKEKKAQYEAVRAKWVEEKKDSLGGHYAWMYGYAVPAISRELAEEALAQEAELAPVPAGGVEAMPIPLAVAYGKVRFLAGKAAEARPFLERGAHACNALDMTFYFMQNLVFLGAAREAEGDKPGACSVYQTVVSRWGRSKESVTVKDVKKRASALGCEIAEGAPG